ncbi:MAG: integration host factor subunit beta [Desulfobacula sp.]|nr:integration host factor subunit beta [Desulfobacula sp.]
MNKLKLIETLKDRCSLSPKKATDIVDLFFFEMANALAKGDRIELRGLWSFHLKAYKSYTGRNPKTGKIVQVASKKLPFFKCGKELKERADYPPN